MATKVKTGRIETLLLNDKLQLEGRRRMLLDLCVNESEEAAAVLENILAAAARSNGQALYEEKKKELDELIDALRDGPQRPGVFLGLVPGNGGTGAGQRRAFVKLQDGTAVYPLVLDEQLAAELVRGDCVLISARAEALVRRDPIGVETGEEARLEAFSDGRVEVSVRSGDERHLCHVTESLRRRLDSGEVRPGSRLLVCTRRAMAFDTVPDARDEANGYRFLSRDPVPQVIVERDVANPPAFIEDLAVFCREEMTDPHRRRRYGLRRSRTNLLTGPSGTGKTLCIQATIRRVYEVVSDVTGVPIDELPPRVLRLKMSVLLSKWLGESDKNADALADEIARLAAIPVSGPRGEYEAPVIVVLEEFDAIARTRGSSEHEPVYDRIQTTLLQRLDHTSNATLRDNVVLIFATTNVPQLMDSAWLRRLGGDTHHFGRLDRRGFGAVLDRHLSGRPLAGDGHGTADPRRRLVNEVMAALYAQGGADPAVVEISLAGSTTPLLKHRRDFLTGSVVDRAVQAACERACRDEGRGTAPGGVSAHAILSAIDSQIDAVVRQLGPANAHEFVDLPSGTRVANVRRLPRPAFAASALERS